jgi:hypothetical protein
MALAILAVHIVILMMCDTGWATGMAGWAQVRLWVAVHSAGKAGQGRMWLQTLRGTQGRYVTIGDLGEGIWRNWYSQL